MVKNNYKIKLINIERSILVLLAEKELCSKDEQVKMYKKIVLKMQKKNDLLLQMRNSLYSSKVKKLNDFLTFTKPTVYFDKKYKLDDSKNQFMWQFIMTRIQEAYFGRVSQLVLDTQDGENFTKAKFWPKFLDILKVEFNLEMHLSSSLSFIEGFGIYQVFTFGK